MKVRIRMVDTLFFLVLESLRPKVYLPGSAS